MCRICRRVQKKRRRVLKKSIEEAAHVVFI
jgi:hypothetical protein